MTPAQEAATKLLEVHKPAYIHDEPPAICPACAKWWPCDTAIVAREVQRLRAVEAAARDVANNRGLNAREMAFVDSASLGVLKAALGAGEVA